MMSFNICRRVVYTLSTFCLHFVYILNVKLAFIHRSRIDYHYLYICRRVSRTRTYDSANIFSVQTNFCLHFEKLFFDSHSCVRPTEWQENVDNILSTCLQITIVNY
jgi:hypothetical protein